MTGIHPLTLVPSPPCVVPHPLLFPAGGWGTVTWSTQNFSLRLIVLAPAKPPTKKAKPPPKSAAQSIPVESSEHVQEFKVKWSRTKKFYTEPVKE